MQLIILISQSVPTLSTQFDLKAHELLMDMARAPAERAEFSVDPAPPSPRLVSREPSPPGDKTAAPSPTTPAPSSPPPAQTHSPTGTEVEEPIRQSDPPAPDPSGESEDTPLALYASTGWDAVLMGGPSPRVGGAAERPPIAVLETAREVDERSETA